MNYISNNRILSLTLSTEDLLSKDSQFILVDDHENVIGLIGKLVSKITVLFFNGKCDYEELFRYIRALHNLPKCLFSSDNNRISKADGIAYMKEELDIGELRKH